MPCPAGSVSAPAMPKRLWRSTLLLIGILLAGLSTRDAEEIVAVDIQFFHDEKNAGLSTRDAEEIVAVRQLRRPDHGAVGLSTRDAEEIVAVSAFHRPRRP